MKLVTKSFFLLLFYIFAFCLLFQAVQARTAKKSGKNNNFQELKKQCREEKCTKNNQQITIFQGNKEINKNIYYCLCKDVYSINYYVTVFNPILNRFDEFIERHGIPNLSFSRQLFRSKKLRTNKN